MHTQQGNLLHLQRGIIVHGCNCQGVMGAGVAAAIRATYPTVFAAYRRLFQNSGLRLGNTQVCCSSLGSRTTWGERHCDAICRDLPSGLVVVNAMTQFDYGADTRKVDYDAISAAFARVRLLARDSGLPVYFPLIGCGLAGGDWTDVAPRVAAALGPAVEATLVVL